MKKIINLALSLLLLVSFTTVVFANEVAPKVTFNATKQEFSFQNVADTTNPDLFTAFKGVIPGDTITQNIDVEISDLANNDTVKIYLKNETTDEVYKELLNSIAITVKNGTEDITAKLNDQILLGEFTKDGIVNLSVDLAIPVTVGNEIQSLEGETDWIFTAEIIEQEVSSEKPSEPSSKPNPVIPQTGGSSNYLLWIVIAVVSIVAIIVIIKVKKQSTAH